MAKFRVRNSKVTRENWQDLRWTQNLGQWLTAEEKSTLRNKFVMSDLHGHKFETIIDVANAEDPSYGATIEQILHAVSERYFDHMAKVNAERAERVKNVVAKRRVGKLTLPEVEWDDENLTDHEQPEDTDDVVEEEDDFDW